MTNWEPATEAERAMRDALQTGDQSAYFRVLARCELLLPIPADSSVSKPGWGTWTAEGRTHVLAFTSPQAMRACLAEHTGAHRRLVFDDLATSWPDPAWWLAINPGLPIEGYLPAWFVGQLSVGDVRLPGRTLGAHARIEHARRLQARSGGEPVSGVPSAPDVPETPAARGGARPAEAPAHNLPPRSPLRQGRPGPGPASNPAAERAAPRSSVASSPVPVSPSSGALGTSPGSNGPLPRRQVPPQESSPAAGPLPTRGAGHHSAHPEYPLPERPVQLPERPVQPERPAQPGRGAGGWQPRHLGPERRDDEPGRLPSRVRRGDPAGFPPEQGTPPAPRYGDVTASPGGDTAGRPAAFVPSAAAPPPTIPDAVLRSPAPPSRGETGGGERGRKEPVPGGETGPASPLGPRHGPGPSGGYPPPAGRASAPGPAQAPERGYGGLPRRRPGSTNPPVPTSGAAPQETAPQPSPPPAPSPSPAPAPEESGWAAMRVTPPSRPYGRDGGGRPIVIEGSIVEEPPDRRHDPDPRHESDRGVDPSESEPGPRLEPGPRARPAAESAWPTQFRSEPVAVPPFRSEPVAVRRTRPESPAPEPTRPEPPPTPATGGRPSAAGRPHPPSSAPSPAPPGSVPAPESRLSQPAGAVGEAPATDRSYRKTSVSDLPTSDLSLTAETPGAGTPPAPGGYGPGPTARPVPAGAAATSGGPVASGGPAASGKPAVADRPATAEDLLRAAPPAPEEPPTEDRATASDAFRPANGVEENLLEAAQQRRTDRFLSTLLLAKVLVPSPNGGPVPDGQRWVTEEIAGAEHLVAYTSTERMTERLGPDAKGDWVRFTTLISSWPREQLSFAVNPDTPVGATLPGDEIVALASWAAKMGLTEEPETEPEPEPAPAASTAPPSAARPADEPLVMQKSISPSQVSLYLDRGYDRASGFVHRASEVDHLCTPGQIYRALGLNYSGSTFRPDGDEVYLLRWRAYRGNLYRIPYGGANEAAMRAMEGWMIERQPFRGNGFAPSEDGDIIAEFKVDSVRLPHGAQLWRLDRDGNERLVALLDADGPRWRLVGE